MCRTSRGVKCVTTSSATVPSIGDYSNLERSFDKFLHVETININKIGNSTSSWSIELTINGLNFIFKIDTGADANILPISYFQKLKLLLAVVRTERVTLRSYTGNKLDILGTCWLG